MIFSCLRRRLFLLLLFAIVSLSPDNANAQCPNGKPPNSDGSCGKRKKEKPVAPPAKPQQQRQRPPQLSYSADAGRSRTNSVANNCSIDVRVTKLGGEPLAAVNLMLDDSVLNIGITDAAGSYKFNNLPCSRDYKITPGRSGFIFNLTSVTITNLTNNSSTAFVASAREKIVPDAIIASTREKIASGADIHPCNPPPTYPNPPRIKFGDLLTGKLNPQTSFCDEKSKRYFHSYRLDGALGGDIIQFDLQSDPASDLIVQVIGQAGKPVAIGADIESDETAGRRLVLPTVGDYTLRVIDRSNRASDYRLSVTRKGLTDEGYHGQLVRAYEAIAEPDKPTFYSSFNKHLERITPYSGKESEKKIKEAAAILEQVREMAPDKPEALTMLAAINLYYRKDMESARELATKALELGGEARFRVDFGEKLDKDLRRITDGNSPCWLIIRKDKITCESFAQSEGEVFTSNPQWMVKKSLDINNYYLGLTIQGRAKKGSMFEKLSLEVGEPAPYYFIPLSLLDMNTRFSLSEIGTIKNLIKQFMHSY